MDIVGVGFIVGTVFCGLMLVATIVGSVLFQSGRPGGGVRRVGRALAITCGGLLLAVVLLGGLGLMQFRRQQGQLVHERMQRKLNEKRAKEERRLEESETRRTTGTHVVSTPNPVNSGLTRLPDDAPADALAPLPAQDDRTERTARPLWTESPLITQGDVILTVIAGQQFATIEEARQDVATEARKQVLADFEKTYHTSARELRDLSEAELRSLAVRQEFVETVERDFGNFFAPMHRVWWQVELSPAVRSELYPLWRGSEQQTRRRIVIFSFATATLGLALVSWLTRRKPVVQPPPQPAATNPVIIGVGAATLLAQRCRRWWK